MSDIFISYSKQDHKRAKDVATRLIQEGWSVFWDRNIPVGSNWDEILEKELNTARVIVTLWSKDSVTSEWVRAEAAEGANRRILVPVVLESVTIPIRFRLLQTADISDWDLGQSDTEGMQLLIEAIARIGSLQTCEEGEARRIVEEKTVHKQSNKDDETNKQDELKTQGKSIDEQDPVPKKVRYELKKLIKKVSMNRRFLFLCLAGVVLISITYTIVQNAYKGTTEKLGHSYTDPKIVKDIDGNEYNVIKIGNQIWMAENLRTTKYRDGKAILLVTDGTAWNYLNTSGYCLYNNFVAYRNSYGALYNWYAVNTRILCPTGWHVPSDAEWTTLTTFLGGDSVAGGKLKETSTVHWSRPNTGATNESGFKALPGGTRYNRGSFYHTGYYGCWWSATEYYNESNAWYRGMSYETCYVRRHYDSKSVGFSVRCLKDN
jgi:uncharacterized protein (TIGR02145 family)